MRGGQLTARAVRPTTARRGHASVTWHEPRISRLIDALAAAGPKALTAIRSARAEARSQVRERAGADAPARSGGPVAALLRPGSAGSNTASDHIETAQLALAQLPERLRRVRTTLIRTGSAGGTHAFLDWLSTTRYDRTPDGYLAGLHLRASMIWLKDLTRGTP